MPTISQLPAATTVDADDSIPISQGGVARAVAAGTLLAQTQPAIMIASPSLLGRISLGPGGPEQIDIGLGLAVNSGTLAADGADHALFASEGSLLLSDEFVVSSSGTPKLIQAPLLRTIFSPGSNITIDASGVISAAVSGSGGEVESPSYSIAGLPQTATISAQDLLGVSQSGVDHSIAYAGLLNGQTIDMAQAAAAAANTDSFWVAQGGSTMVRQTLGALWTWIASNAPSVTLSVTELTGNTELIASAHNGRILVCSQPLTLSASVANLGNGFWCELVNVSSGSITLSGGISTTSGSSTVLSGQVALLRCVSYSGGTIVYAMVSGTQIAGSVPGPALSLSATAVGTTSVTLAWQPPISGGAASAYTVQYCVSGTGAWTQAAQGVEAISFIVTGLSASVSYNFSVISTNAAGSGALSNICTVSTTTTLLVPDQVTGVSVAVNSGTGVTVSWSAPSSGGPVSSYTVQYRLTGTTAWTGTVAGVTGTFQAVQGLSQGTSYDFSVVAINSAGSGAISGVVTSVTSGQTGAVSSITWNVPPSGSYAPSSGSIGVNAHVSPASAAVQFGFSTSATVPPSSWAAGVLVNTNLWGAYVAVPSTAGSWFAWVEGTDGSCPTVCQTAFTVT